MIKPTSATARIKLTLEIDVRSMWGGDCQVSQVWEQAKKETLAMLDEKLNKAISLGSVRVIGEPKIIAILVEGQ